MAARFILFALLLVIPAPSAGQPHYTARPDDTQAVHVSRDRFDVAGDGAADDTEAIQRAIDACSSCRTPAAAPCTRSGRESRTAPS